MARYTPEGLEGIRKGNAERFLEDAKTRYGGKFDYSLADYRSQKAPITIVCPIHGRYQQTPSRHLSAGHGRPKCGVAARSGGRINKGRDTFLKLISEKYGDRLEVLSEYISSHSPIKWAHRALMQSPRLWKLKQLICSDLHHQ